MISFNGIKQSVVASALVLAMLFGGFVASAPQVNASLGEEHGQDMPDLVASSSFHVQAGAFSVRDNAVSLQRQLRESGYAAKIIDGDLYRVWVGGYLNRATAERLASHLRADGFEWTLSAREK